MMKRPLSALLAVLLTCLLLATTVSYGYNAALSVIGSYNLCNLPLMDLIPICATPGGHTSLSVDRVDFPGLMSIQHRALDGFVGQSTTGSELALDIKHAELTVQELVLMVKGSDLTIKGPLSDTLNGFVVGAKDTSRSLQRLSSKILGTIDRCVSTTSYRPFIAEKLMCIIFCHPVSQLSICM